MSSRAIDEKVIKTLCDEKGKCSYHEDGGDDADKCLAHCDYRDCRRLGEWVLNDCPVPLPSYPAHFCAAHILALMAEHNESEFWKEKAARVWVEATPKSRSPSDT